MFAPNCSTCQNGIVVNTLLINIRRGSKKIVVHVFTEFFFTMTKVTISEMAPPAIMIKVCQP